MNLPSSAGKEGIEVTPAPTTVIGPALIRVSPDGSSKIAFSDG